MYIFLMIVHVFVSIVLISVILLQAGRGGGLSEAFSGISPSRTIFGTSATTFLTRATEACAVLFIVTCLSLAILSSARSRSLVLSSPDGMAADTLPAGLPLSAEDAEEASSAAGEDADIAAGAVTEAAQAAESPIDVPAGEMEAEIPVHEAAE